jgi:hypothetical protein
MAFVLRFPSERKRALRMHESLSEVSGVQLDIHQVLGVHRLVPLVGDTRVQPTTMRKGLARPGEVA